MSGATRGFAASSASPSEGVRSRKAERYEIRDGRSSREAGEMCCIIGKGGGFICCVEERMVIRDQFAKNLVIFNRREMRDER